MINAVSWCCAISSHMHVLLLAHDWCHCPLALLGQYCSTCHNNHGVKTRNKSIVFVCRCCCTQSFCTDSAVSGYLNAKKQFMTKQYYYVDEDKTKCSRTWEKTRSWHKNRKKNLDPRNDIHLLQMTIHNLMMHEQNEMENYIFPKHMHLFYKFRGIMHVVMFHQYKLCPCWSRLRMDYRIANV